MGGTHRGNRLPAPQRPSAIGRIRRVGLGLVALLAVAGGCKEASVTEVPVAVDRVDLVAPQTSVPVGQTVQFTATPRSPSGQGMTARTVTWASNNEAVAQVDASGRVTGVSPGSAAITASVSGRSASVDVTVTPSARIDLSLTSVPFAANVGAADPAARTVGVTNGGGGTLSGLAVTVQYGTGQPTGWLEATLDRTTAPATLTLRARTQGRSAGVYTAQVSVTSALALNSPQTVAVQFTLTAGPSIQLSATSLTFTGTAGGGNPPAQTVDITNGGSGSLTDLGGAIGFPPGGAQNWLAGELNRTTAPAVLTLQPSITGLPPGTHQATVVIGSPVASNSPRTITVTLTLTAPPTAPTLTNVRASFVQVNAPPTACNGNTGFSLFEYVVSYADPNGDVPSTISGTLEFAFNPDGNSGAVAFTRPRDGDGFSGELVLRDCAGFGAPHLTSLTLGISILDQSGRRSNTVQVTLQRPVGAPVSGP